MAKGHKTGGRKKGTPNKFTSDVREMIIGALQDVGGQKYLALQASESPVAFLGLVGKVLPLQAIESDTPLSNGSVTVASIGVIEAARRLAFALSRAARMQDAQHVGVIEHAEAAE